MRGLPELQPRLSAHLFLANEILSAMLNTHHNLYFYLDTLRQIRDAIASHRFLNYIMEFKARQGIGRVDEARAS
jgi:queuine tRNA-ribosyltransferase